MSVRKNSRRRGQQKRSASPGGLCCREPQVRRCCTKNAGAPGSTPSGAPAPSPAKVPVRLQTPCLVLRSKQGRGVWRGRFGWGGGDCLGWKGPGSSLASVFSVGVTRSCSCSCSWSPRSGVNRAHSEVGSKVHERLPPLGCFPAPTCVRLPVSGLAGRQLVFFSFSCFPGFRLIKRRAYCPTL